MLRTNTSVEMVDQHRSQASVQQPKYDTYAKPVLLSQPEKQRTSIHVSSESPDSAAAGDHGARKVTPGKLDLSKLRSLSHGDIKATPDPAGALRAPRKTPPDPSSGSGADVDNAGKENLLSPGRLVDLPNGTPLSRHPSDALSRKASPKALLDGDCGASQGQITIVAEACPFQALEARYALHFITLVRLQRFAVKQQVLEGIRATLLYN